MKTRHMCAEPSKSPNAVDRTPRGAGSLASRLKKARALYMMESAVSPTVRAQRLARDRGEADEQAGHRPAVAGAFPDRLLPGSRSGAWCRFWSLSGISRTQRRRAWCLRSVRPRRSCSRCSASSPIDWRCRGCCRRACFWRRRPCRWEHNRPSYRRGAVGVRAERPGCGGVSPGSGPQGSPRQRRSPDDRHEPVLGRGRPRIRPGAGAHDGPIVAWGTAGLLAPLGSSRDHRRRFLGFGFSSRRPCRLTVTRRRGPR